MSKFASSSLAALAGMALLFQGCSEASGFQDSGPGDDAGPVIDAGPGSDAGDGGRDAGSDAGLDAGSDAGPDGGPDAGPPQFGTPILSTMPGGGADMAVADFNGDQKLDLVITQAFPYYNYGSNAQVLLGNGDGTFQAATEYPTSGVVRGVAVLDLNGDGLPDFAVGTCDDGGSALAMFLNVDGGFAPRVDLPVSSCPHSLAVADLNGDGLPDIAAAGPGPIPYYSAGEDGGIGEVNLLINQGGGAFAVRQTLTTDAPASGIVSTDLNGDQIPDLAVLTNADRAVVFELRVWLGVDGGPLQALPPVSLDKGGYVALAAGDLDGDGHQDLALVGTNQNVMALLIGKGDGTFQAPTYQTASGNPVAVATGDLTGKGHLDIASASSNAYFQGLSIYPGGRTPPAPPIGIETRLLSDGASYGLAIADFTGDGRADIAVSLLYRGAVAVLPGLSQPPLLPDPATFKMAPHIALPTVPYQGGPIIQNPDVITLTFRDDPNTALFQLYADWIVGSEWLATIGAPYGIGLGRNANYVLAQDAPEAITDAEIQSFINDVILDGGVPPPVAQPGQVMPQQMYFLYFPHDTSAGKPISIAGPGGSGTNCTNFGAYHNESVLGSVSYAYAVIPTCDTGSPFRQESAVSHELAEAATDPLVSTRPAYTSGQTFNSGLIGETADVCTGFENFYQLDGGTIVEAQRIWSNPSAIGNSQPCIPLPGGVYANISPEQAGSTFENAYPMSAGGSIDIPLTGWTTAPSVPFSIVALGYPKYGLAPVSTYPDVSLSKWNIANGEQAVLTVKMSMDAVSGDFGMITLLSGFDEENYGYWPLIIYVP